MIRSERWWWLSFCDADRPVGQQFLGACLVQARGVILAAQEAHMRGCNPGGEVRILEASADFQPKPGWANRLLSRKECEEFDRVHMQVPN